MQVPPCNPSPSDAFRRNGSDGPARVRVPRPEPTATAAAHPVASQTADNNVEKGDDAVDNGRDYAANAVNNGH